jgi:hypothetical protein
VLLNNPVDVVVAHRMAKYAINVHSYNLCAL